MKESRVLPEVDGAVVPTENNAYRSPATPISDTITEAGLLSNNMG